MVAQVTSIRIEDIDGMDFSDVAESGEKLPPVTPGEILLEDFLKPLGMSQYRLAKEIGVPQRRFWRNAMRPGSRGSQAPHRARAQWPDL